MKRIKHGSPAHRRNGIVFFFLLMTQLFPCFRLFSAEPTVAKPAEPVHTGSWFFTGGTIGMLNADGAGVTEMPLPQNGGYGGVQSAPSQILAAGGVGLRIPADTLIRFVPSLTGFAGYWLWNGVSALPAEAEHRTAFVPALLLDLPAVISFQAGSSVFSAGAGAAFLLRYAFLAGGVPQAESADIDLMNAWFWQDSRFFYPSAQIGWDYVTKNGWAIGAVLRCYLPLSPFFDEEYRNMTTTEKFDSGMLLVSVRFSVPEIR